MVWQKIKNLNNMKNLFFLLMLLPFVAFSQADEEFRNLKSNTLFAAGEYTFNLGATVGSLSINNSFEDAFEFTLKTTTDRGCFGEVSGTSTVFGNQAKFTGTNGCVLVFKITGNQIDVTEKNCSHYHGMNCGIGGLFTKKELWPADKVATLKKSISEGVQAKGVHSSLAAPMADCLIEKIKTQHYTMDEFLAKGGINSIRKEDLDNCAIQVFKESATHIKCK